MFVLSSIGMNQPQTKPFQLNQKNQKKTLNHLNQHSYKILCTQLLKEVTKPETVAQIILTHLQMPEENYRMGKTKVYCFNLMDG